jgi:hypothetical protein
MAETKPKDDIEAFVRFGASSIARLIAFAMPFGIFREDLLEDIVFRSIKSGAASLAELRGKLAITPSEVQEEYSNRVKMAGEHLQLAGSILTELQNNLEQQSQQLVAIQADLEKRKQDAEYWKKLADINKDSAAVLTGEIERAMRQQIRKELDRGKTLRTIGGFIGWVITLLLGGVVGAAIQQIWQTGKLF